MWDDWTKQYTAQFKTSVKLVELVLDQGYFLIQVNYGKGRFFEAEVEPATAFLMLAFNSKSTR